MSPPRGPYVAFKPENLAVIERAKKRGNEAHAERKYGQAIIEYGKAIACFFDSITPMPAPPDAPPGPFDPGTLLAQLYANRSSAFLRDKKFDRALADGQEGAKHSRWYKPRYRQGEAWLALREYSKALESFEEAIRMLGPTVSDQSDEGLWKSRVDQIQKKIMKTETMRDDETLGFRLHQISPSNGDLCAKLFLAPIQNLVFSYARQMKNFIYLCENIATSECLVVDACWDIDGILKYAHSRKLKIVGAIVTHAHIDHVGGIPPPPFDIPGIRVDGLAKLLKKLPNISAYVNPGDIPAITKANPEIPLNRLVKTEDGGTICLPMSLNGGTAAKLSPSHSPAGKNTIFQFIHTPGHSPGSQCILINGNRLLSGDTLFIKSCGRVDFPDSSVSDMHHSLQKKLATLPDDVVVYPGHGYGGDMTTIEDEKRTGVLQAQDYESFAKIMNEAVN
ncbi:beta-lactamase-like protein [Geranomyces variabilis]|nr:beta-lactamase-like protein [Geranomyces variabilis]KAJ3138727.1 hypothetical protein HDU90_001171 [Geranomyces variabilis]